ncbi:MAG: glycogen debranching protein GlgX [Cardiobacteriaceae bacterium]|nr:glycogen debranching protein GlgX [Cardiobacteriaceae bacterium]
MSAMPSLSFQTGKPYPLGASLEPNGINFALASRCADKIELCVFMPEEKRFALTQTGDIWHGFLALDAPHFPKDGVLYGYRVYGQHQPEYGLFANPNKLLLDPYAKVIVGEVDLSTEQKRAWFHHDDPRDNAHLAPKALCLPDEPFDWEEDKPPRHDWSDTFIYEAHVKGLTQLFPHLKNAGSYLALSDERVIQHLKALGITAIELLPIHQHLDEWQLQARGLTNYWGYNTLSAFALEPRYAQNPKRAAWEFKTAVKALHRAGIEVILDVVYNHSAEQDLSGAMLSQRGIDNQLWYLHDDHHAPLNLSGCGNTINVAEPLVTRWLLDSLRYWVTEFHIDGFRFDLATILGREYDEQGQNLFQRQGKFFHTLQQDPILAPCKLIAEAWDLGTYQVGHFPTNFSQWNGAFRDDMRSFWLEQNGRLDTLAKRFAGSDDYFYPKTYRPHHSLNFITAHDGFTLCDVVSYQHKHNLQNGENNRDGHHDNRSHNFGEEGISQNPDILKKRHRAQSALLASLILSKGTPMLLAGDELNHSQLGNNNAYCQDNKTTWLHWSNPIPNFTSSIKALWQLRTQIPALREDRWLDHHHVQWLSPEGLPMQVENWHDHSRKAMQIRLNQRWSILINGKDAPETFTLPQSALKLCFTTSPALSPHHTFQVSSLGLWVFYHEELNDEQP